MGIEFHADGQTDMTKLIVAFRDFANRPKNEFKIFAFISVFFQSFQRKRSWIACIDPKRQPTHQNCYVLSTLHHLSLFSSSSCPLVTSWTAFRQTESLNQYIDNVTRCVTNSTPDTSAANKEECQLANRASPTNKMNSKKLTNDLHHADSGKLLQQTVFHTQSAGSV